MSICVFTGGLYPAPEQAAHIFSKAGLPDYVIAADSGLYAAEAYQQRYHFEINCITGDMDSLGSPDALSRYSNEIIDRHPRDKDDTDTELALRKAALRRGVDAGPVILIGGAGGRLDHTLAITHLFGSSLAPDIWLCANQAVYAVGEGHGKSLEISGLAATDPISIFPATAKGEIRDDGLFWNIANLQWDEGAYSLSNKIAPHKTNSAVSVTDETASGLLTAVRFEVVSGVFLVIVPLRVQI
jgi:thiamine pyrophosphokinase